jgi:hypothetical protein
MYFLPTTFSIRRGDERRTKGASKQRNENDLSMFIHSFDRFQNHDIIVLFPFPKI